MHNILKITNVKRRVFFIVIFLFCFTQLYSQDISEFTGIHKGKLNLALKNDISKWTFNYNEISVNISTQNRISISFHFKMTNEEGIFHDYKGSIEGTVNKDLTYQAKGLYNYESNLDFSLDLQNDKDPIDAIKGNVKKTTGNADIMGKIIEGFINGDLYVASEKVARTKVFYFKILLSKNKEEEVIPQVETKKEDCDVKIIIPEGLKPGGRLYVITKTTGCVKSEVVYYNGKDNQISNWDGKAVNVEVQITCCNSKAFYKTFQVPAYGSNEKVEIKTEETNKGGSLPTPPVKQVFTGTAISLALLKLLQGLLNGRGKGTGSTIPPPPPKPPKIPKIQTEIKKDPKITNDNVKTDDKSKPENKSLTSKQKEERMKFLKERQEELVKRADKESVTLNPKTTLIKNLIQTVPNTLNEIKETGKSIISAGKKLGELGLELYNNPMERERLDRNFMNTFEHAKTELTDYYNCGKYKDDFKEMSNKLWDINKEYLENFWNDPKKTLGDYISTAFGTSFYKNAFNQNKPLGERLLNLGAGYIKTILTLGTAETSCTPFGIFNKFTYHQTTLISQKLAPLIPGLLEKGKEKVIVEAIQIKVHNKLNEYMKKPENTTMIHNINDMIENFNDGYMKNGIFVHYGEGN